MADEEKKIPPEKWSVEEPFDISEWGDKEVTLHSPEELKKILPKGAVAQSAQK